MYSVLVSLIPRFSFSVLLAFQEDPGRLSLAFQDLAEVPADVAQQHGPTLTFLDLTGNRIRSGANLSKFVVLHTLVLDKNSIENLNGFPVLPSLDTLYLNNNNISELSSILATLQQIVCLFSFAACGLARHFPSALFFPSAQS